MTIEENNNKKSYRSINLYKYNKIEKTNLYLHLELLKNKENKSILIKYLVLNGSQLNYIPMEPINLNTETIINNKIIIDINKFVRLNIIICDKLYNTNIMKYKFNYSYTKLSLSPLKTFLNICDLRYLINNKPTKLNITNTKIIEEDYFNNLMSQLNIN